MKMKLYAIVLCIVLAFSMAVPAFAAGNEPVIPPEPEDYGEPIQVTSYYDEELGVTVTERTYFVPDQPEISLLAEGGSGWFKKEAIFPWEGDPDTIFYAQGYFTWGNGDVSVSSPSVGYDQIPRRCTLVSSNESHGTGRYAGIFNKYAYVTHTLTIKNMLNDPRTITVTCRVSESGNLI